MSEKKTESLLHQVADDEIDLVQLFQILLKRKSLIAVITLLCLLIGLGYALLKKPIYEYTTAVQIGTALVSASETASRHWIEESTSVKLKLDKVYIPAAINQLSGKYSGHIASAVVKESKNSNILLIASKGAAEDVQFFKDLHTIAVAPLIANHRELIAASKNQYELLAQNSKLILKDLEDPKIFGIDEIAIKGAIESAQLDLAGIQDQKKLLLANKSGLEETKKLLHKQIGQIEVNLKLSYSKRDKVISEVSDEAKAMTFLMLNSDIQQNENRLAMLRERLNVNLENEKQKIKGQFAQNLRLQQSQMTKIDGFKNQLIQLQAQRSSNQDKQRNAIATAENKINLYQDTKVLGFAMRSLIPLGTGRSIIVVLAGMLGLMGGVMGAFFAEFITKVLRAQKTVG